MIKKIRNKLSKRSNKYLIIFTQAIILSLLLLIFSHENIISHPNVDSLKWDNISVANPFPGRSAHKSIVFKGKLWVIGGWNGSTAFNDIWSSKNGKKWNMITNNAPFCKRAGFSLTKFRNNLWLIGGLCFDKNKNIKDLNDIWKSKDGIHWEEVTSHAPFCPRGGHSAIVFHNSLLVISGIAKKSNIWKTNDGIHWNKIKSNPEFGARGGHATLVFRGKLWTIGGFYVDKENNFKSLSDVWNSIDGITWEKVVEETSFFAGGGHSSVIFNNKIWIMGGFRKSGSIFSSPDGIHWNQVEKSGEFGERVAHTSVSFKNAIWVIGGYNGAGYKDDIWEGLNETTTIPDLKSISLNTDITKQ